MYPADTNGFIRPSPSGQILQRSEIMKERGNGKSCLFGLHTELSTNNCLV